MAKFASEAGLRNGADPEAFADAIMRCQGYSPNCSYYGVCELDGECFGRKKQTCPTCNRPWDGQRRPDNQDKEGLEDDE